MAFGIGFCGRVVRGGQAGGRALRGGRARRVNKERPAWATASEKNSASFAVERSLDGRMFAAIGTAAAGSSRSARRYEWLDA